MENKFYQPVTVGDWIVTFLLMCIPFVNIILLFVWAFGGGTPISKANWAKAALIWMAIVMGIYFVGIMLFFILGAALLSTAG